MQPHRADYNLVIVMTSVKAVLVVACMALVSPTFAQTLPSEPIVFGDGRAAISGDVSASFGTKDPLFFNFTEYDHSALRTVRLDVSGIVHAGPHFSVLGEMRAENHIRPQPYALYLRIRPWIARDVDIQIGRVPPTFGAFARRTYANDNPLIGYPLAYQYLTTLRPDSVPATADELLRRRGSGWLVRFSYGDQTAAPGVPLMTAFEWDTGVQVHAAKGIVSGTASVTNGTLSHPVFRDDNNGRQIATRIELRPVMGLIVGTSFARGPFVTEVASRGAVGDGHDREFTQTAWGLDGEYSRGHYLLRYEAVFSDWRLPLLPTLRATAMSVEGRYKIMPGLYAAARVDGLTFSDLRGTTRTAPWDSPVSRLEIGTGISIQRNLVWKLAYQHDRRAQDGGRLGGRDDFAATQLVFWF
jgi:hypothetical protein